MTVVTDDISIKNTPRELSGDEAKRWSDARMLVNYLEALVRGDKLQLELNSRDLVIAKEGVQQIESSLGISKADVVKIRDGKFYIER